MRRRFQFSLRALLLLMLIAAAFFGGMAVQRQLDRPEPLRLRKRAKALPVDIVVGVHGRDLEEAARDLAKKLEAAGQEQKHGNGLPKSRQ